MLNSETQSHKVVVGEWQRREREKKNLAPEFRTGYSSRGPGCNSQHPHGSSQPSITPVAVDPILSFGLSSQLYTYSAQIYIKGKTHTHTKSQKTLIKKFRLSLTIQAVYFIIGRGTINPC